MADNVLQVGENLVQVLHRKNDTMQFRGQKTSKFENFPSKFHFSHCLHVWKQFSYINIILRLQKLFIKEWCMQSWFFPEIGNAINSSLWCIWQQIPTHSLLLHWGVSTDKAISSYWNIPALPQTHKSQSWCHWLIKLSADLAPNNWTNILYIDTTSINKVLPVSTFHHAEFCLSKEWI